MITRVVNISRFFNKKYEVKHFYLILKYFIYIIQSAQNKIVIIDYH